MDFGLTWGGVLVVSSGVDPQGLTAVPEHTAASVDLVTRHVKRLEIASPPAP